MWKIEITVDPADDDEFRIVATQTGDQIRTHEVYNGGQELHGYEVIAEVARLIQHKQDCL